MSGRSRRLALLTMRQDDIELSNRLAADVGARFFVEGEEAGELAERKPTRLRLDDTTELWFRPSVLRSAAYIKEGAQSLAAGEVVVVSAPSARAIRESVDAAWRVIRACTVGKLWSVNPVIGEPIRPAKDVRIGAAALSFWRNGGLLNSGNAHLFYMPIESATIGAARGP